MDDQKFEPNNPNENLKKKAFFDHAIADMLSNKNLNPIANELGKKTKISLVFISVPKNIKLNSNYSNKLFYYESSTQARTLGNCIYCTSFRS